MSFLKKCGYILASFGIAILIPFAAGAIGIILIAVLIFVLLTMDREVLKEHLSKDPKDESKDS